MLSTARRVALNGMLRMKTFDTDRFEANAKKLGAYCAVKPTIGLITATDKLFGK
jgi:hypothetical protein